LGYPSKAHQAEARHNPSHDNPHCAGEQDVITSTVICFPHSILVPLVKRLSLANLHHVSPITAEHSATTLPPPSVPRAGMLAPRCRARRCQSSLIPTEDVIASFSCLLDAGWCAGTVLTEGEVVEANHQYRFGYGVSASFAIFGLRRFKHRFLSSA
jgi:hypothetical protein